MNADLAIPLTAFLVAVSSTLLGSFLLLRRLSLMADAISHAVLPGIVAAFWLSGGSRASLPSLLGAALAGLLTVTLVEGLTRSGRVRNDAAIGLVFPALFAVGVVAVSLYFRNIHLDLDAVLYGEIAYVPFHTWQWGSRDLGPVALWLMGGLTLLNLLFVLGLFKELKVATFDPGLAAALGFRPGWLHYLHLSLVSLTVVGAFEAVGAILIVALMVIPAATAFLLSSTLTTLLVWGVAQGAVISLGGYGLALLLDASIAGSMATVALGLFLLALLLAPHQGLLSQYRLRQRQRLEVWARLLVAHLAHHPGAVSAQEVLEELGWTAPQLERSRKYALQTGWVAGTAQQLILGPNWRQAAVPPSRYISPDGQPVE